MSIRGNIGLGTIDIAAADTTVYDPAAAIERYAISALSVFNTGGANVTVSLYTSPNLTSASGKKVAQYVVPPTQSVDITELIGQGFPQATNIIAVGSATNCNITGTVTTYDGGD